MGSAIQYPITEPFGTAAVPSDINLPIPVPSQISITPGAASFADGFPPVTFVDPDTGGAPPSGADFNGLLYMITQYCVALQTGAFPIYDVNVSTAISGYPEGAVLGKASGYGLWTNTVPGNTSDPDTGGAGWLDGVPAGAGYLSDTLTSGTHNNLAPTGFGPTVAFLDIDISAGNSVVTGLAGGADGQTVTITPVNSGSNTLTLNSLDSGSSAANRFRLSTDVILTQYVPQTLRYSSTLDLWIPIS
jgi:hypothetical protein